MCSRRDPGDLFWTLQGWGRGALSGQSSFPRALLSRGAPLTLLGKVFLSTLASGWVLSPV